MSLSIESMTEDDVDAAADLLATREAARASLEPATPARLDDPEVAREIVRRAFENAGADAVVARRAGRVAGFMIGRRLLPSPLAVDANFVWPRTAFVDDVSSAAGSDEDEPVHLFRALYATLAEGWVGAAYTAHVVNVLLADRPALAAWRSLGFGIDTVRGLRDTAPVAAGAPAPGVQVHRAGEEDAGEIAALAIANLRYHADPPMFQAYFPETEPALRAYEADALKDSTTGRFIAVSGGRTAGIATFLPWAPERRGALHRTAHLQHGFTLASERGRGVASALLDAGMAWLREQGFERCTVNWVGANPLGARFWQAQGFRPFGYRLVRHLDDRVAWARSSGN